MWRPPQEVAISRSRKAKPARPVTPAAPTEAPAPALPIVGADVTRNDAFSALSRSLTRHQRAAAERLVADLAELYGVAGSFGVSGSERIQGSPAHLLSTERKCEARRRLNRELAKLGAADRALLVALAEPIVFGTFEIGWRQLVKQLTGETNEAAQGARVRAALENLRLAYGLGEAPRLHPFDGPDPQPLIGTNPMPLSSAIEAHRVSPQILPPPTAAGPGSKGLGPVVSGTPEEQALGRYVLTKVLLFTQVSERQFRDKAEKSTGVSYARALAAYLLHVELEFDQVACARILPLT